MKWLGFIIIIIIKVYKKIISPFFPSSCRFTPSCSSYFIEAIEKHGPFKGSTLGLNRILRCNPWGGFGDDPVP